MARPKNSAVGRKRKLTPYLLILACMAVIMALAILYGDKGFFYYMRLEEHKRGLVEANAEWREKNRKLYQSIEGLRHDPEYIEKTARRELGLVKEGELVYIFESPESP